MTIPVVSRSPILDGLAFDIDDHGIISDWAKSNDHRAIVWLDHGMEGEEYDEVIIFAFGVQQRCRFILWRTAHAVFVQPLIGRRQQYNSVREALASPLLNKAINGETRGGTARRRPASYSPETI
jgi:hypothetical protein